MKIEVFCAQCGHSAEYDLDTKEIRFNTTIGGLLVDRKWIFQQNGENFDIYCSKECAA